MALLGTQNLQEKYKNMSGKSLLTVRRWIKALSYLALEMIFRGFTELSGIMPQSNKIRLCNSSS